MALSIKQTLAERENRNFIREWIAEHPQRSRTALAQDLCDQLGLRDGKGDRRLATTLKALRDLENEDFWVLPQSKCQGPRSWNPIRLDQPLKPPEKMPKQAEQIMGLELVEVQDKEHLRIWNELMIREHPLHDARLVGRQTRYLIGSTHGWLGAIGVGSAALHLESRDKWLGWDHLQRMEHLPRVANLSRFLIRPMVHCRNLASHVLALFARRVPEDYERRYGVRLWLLESFVETPTYQGSCYQAANWIKVGRTKGRGRNGDHDEAKSLKDVYLYPLVEDLAGRVGVKRRLLSPLAPESGLDAQSWAEQEFGGCQLGDLRRSRRLVEIARQQALQPSGSYTQAAGGDRYKTKGYYRFLNCRDKDFSVSNMLSSHRTQTLRRMNHQETVLVIQDTTDGNFSSRWHCTGLGQIGTNQTGAKSYGLKLHSSIALAEDGSPLGVLRLEGYPPESTKGKDPDRPIEQKESYRWLKAYQDAMEAAAQLDQTHVVCVCDREADIFELFDLHRRQSPKNLDLLVRASRDRGLEGTDEYLFEEVAQMPCAKTLEIEVPRQREHVGKPSTPGRPSLPARKANVEMRYGQVTLRPPHKPGTRHSQPIKLSVVHVVEKNPPEGAAAIEWILLSTGVVNSVKQALKCLRRYCRRWRIEEWHRVLKSGCKILDHQNHSAETLLRAIAIDAVIAWRIMLLALLGREAPGMSCKVLFNQWECEVLERLAKKKTRTWRGIDRDCQTRRLPQPQM